MRWRVLLSLWSVALCFFPLLNLLSFEFAFACCLPLSFFGAHCGLKAQEKCIWQDWLNSIKLASFTVFIPLFPVINGIWVRNCNRLVGLGYYFALSLFSVIIAAGYGVLIKWYLSRPSSSSKQKVNLEQRGLLIFAALFIITVIWGVAGFILTPSVDVFSTFMGYYPGAIYDEELVIGGRLLLSRFEDLTLIGAVLAFCQKTQVKAWYQRFNTWAFLLVFTTFAAWSADLHRPKFWVQYRLGGEISDQNY